MEAKHRDITVREKPSAKVFASSYGMVTWVDWLAFEVARFAGHGRKVRIDKNDKGELALVDA